MYKHTDDVIFCLAEENRKKKIVSRSKSKLNVKYNCLEIDQWEVFEANVKQNKFQSTEPLVKNVYAWIVLFGYLMICCGIVIFLSSICKNK